MSGKVFLRSKTDFDFNKVRPSSSFAASQVSVFYSDMTSIVSFSFKVKFHEKLDLKPFLALE